MGNKRPDLDVVSLRPVECLLLRSVVDWREMQTFLPRRYVYSEMALACDGLLNRLSIEYELRDRFRLTGVGD